MMTEGLRSCPLTAGIRAEAFPTRSQTLGSLSSHRVWLLACTSLQAKKKTTMRAFQYIGAEFLESLMHF